MNQERRGCHYVKHIEHSKLYGKKWTDKAREAQLKARHETSAAYQEYKRSGGLMMWHEYRKSLRVK